MCYGLRVTSGASTTELILLPYLKDIEVLNTFPLGVGNVGDSTAYCTIPARHAVLLQNLR
jgi:hypothetical protein